MRRCLAIRLDVSCVHQIKDPSSNSGVRRPGSISRRRIVDLGFEACWLEPRMGLEFQKHHSRTNVVRPGDDSHHGFGEASEGKQCIKA